ncbi:MAG: DEAD/DEAH box helicase family protein [Candidatus Methanoperedens sp.]|nr:DEAD/DEAH box helicase family protein [Candidatus Methanoperedens sp.]
MLEKDEIDQIISEFKSKIENRPEKVIYKKYRTFLKEFEMKNRNFEKLELILKRLKKQKIIPCSKENGELIELKHSWDLTEIPLDETIYFKLKDLNNPNEGKLESIINDAEAGSIIDKETTDINSKSKMSVPYAGRIEVVNGNNPRSLYKHQEEAVQQLDKKIIKTNKYPFAGLLVLPTGGGKTLTAVQWLLRNYIDNNKKILWIAHRHELLEQALETFKKNAYSNILKNKKSFNYRIISGLSSHDKPVNIKANDDIIVASKDSLNSGLEYLLRNWIKNNDDELFLVIDEAHHATAKTYRRLINSLKNNVNEFRMLGLTATPFRTAENENGLLEKVFPDDIIYKVDLRTLIGRGILSEPIFKEIKTNIDLTKDLSDSDLKKISKFDFNIDILGKETAKTIAENKTRNNRIVDHFFNYEKEYKQTLIFALNVDNAIALNALFREKGIESDYVVSTIHDAVTGVTISAKQNKDKIERFRKGDLKVLINVNILTEGTDLPRVQTVFLTRPTISPVLMTQMIGRGLRGEKAGGTKYAYIVSFIDDWKDKIAWVNPEKLFIEENVDFNDDTPETEKRFIRLISIEKLEEFAKIMDKSIDTDDLKKLDFIERLPVGLYSFSLLKSSDKEEENQKNCEILVYDNIKKAYSDFINELPEFFKINNLKDKEILNENELVQLCKIIEDEYFYGCEKLPGYRIEDIKDVLRYYALYENLPQFIEFKDREKFDITNIADNIYKKDLGERARKEYLMELWEKEQNQWKAFFGFDQKYFINEVYLALQKQSFPEPFEKSTAEPTDTKEQRELEKLSMSELREKFPLYWRKLRDTVFENNKDENGFYTCAISGEKSKSKLNFQIDHIKPLSKGGLTTLENLQILTRKENAIKGDQL